MAILTYMLIIIAVLKSSRADSSTMEKFLSSGFNKDDTEKSQDKENTDVPTENDLLKFMKRAGLLGSDNGDKSIGYNQPKSTSTFQPTKQQQASIYYLPQQSNYVAPKRQLQTPQIQQLQLSQQQLQQLQQQLLQRQQQLQQQQLQQQQQRQSLPLSSSNEPLNTEPLAKNIADVEPQQDSASKAVAKADRQGLYGHDAGNYDTGNHDGYDGYSDAHSSSYSGGSHYSPEPVYHKPVYHKPEKSIAIKIDPISILRLLLSGIPKPLLNLNGKLFFGVELGKNAGIVTGHVPPKKPHYGGTVLTFG